MVINACNYFKKYIAILLAFLPIQCIYTQIPDTIFYQNEIVLTGSMFKASAPDSTVLSKHGSNLAAHVKLELFIQGRYTFDYGKVQIEAILHTNKSWIRTPFSDDKNVLKHELYHFKITEIYARKLKKSLLGLNGMSLSQFAKEAVQLETEITHAHKMLQAAYDNETKHSNNIQKQQEWELKIDQELEDLEQYTNPQIIVFFSQE